MKPKGRQRAVYPCSVSAVGATLPHLAEPVVSGLTWKPDPAKNPVASGGRTKLRWMRSEELPTRRALFKSPAANQPHELYALGMERVAYRLGVALGLRVPTVWLETVNGENGALLERIEARDLQMAKSCVMLMTDVVDEGCWPLAVAFDIWLANTDRLERNVLVEPLPIGKPAKHAVRCRTWWIDHGFTGLMPPGKFGVRFKDSAPEDVTIGTGDMTAVTPLGEIGEVVVRTRMVERLRNKFLALDPSERRTVLDRVRAVRDDAIDQAINEVPGAFMNRRQADLTAQLLKLRRDAIDMLVAAHW